jgi:uncharacterized protein
MRLSKYIKMFEYDDDPDYLIAYSTRLASAILLPKTALDQLEKGGLDPSDQETLSELGFLVSCREEEKREVLAMTADIDSRTTTFSAIVVMNVDCNLRCTYCFEGTMKGRHYISSETLRLLVGFLEKNALLQGKNINIDFYGGEPLLSLDAIKKVSEELRPLAEAQGLTYTFNLVTNGTLLTAARVKELAGLGMKSAKLTVDGPKENHDIFRPFKSGSGSFEIIMQNIRDICDLTDIQIGGNYTKENYRSFPGLLDYFIREGLSPDKFSVVKFDPVIKPGGKYGLPDFRDGSESINEPWIFNASLFIREEILKRGFKTVKILPSPCMVGMKNYIVINHDGRLYKCPGMIGWDGYEAGDLRSGISPANKNSFNVWKNEECLDCEYLPLCFGGCMYMKVLRDGNAHEVDCKKPYLDATLETLVRQELKYMPGTGK